MHLYLNAYPSRLTRDKGMFSIKNDKTEEIRLSPYKVSSICLTRACLVSTDAMILAAKHEIPIILMLRNGKPVGRLWSPYYKSIATIRRQQILFSQSPEVAPWLIDRLERKAGGQIRLIDQLGKRKGKKGRQVETHVENMKLLRDQLAGFRDSALAESGDALRGIEGNISLHYHKTINLYLPRAYRFTTRSRRPAKDLYNAALNYSYGMLYNLVNTALLAAGLDPYLSMFHSEAYNRAALSFDFIEPYRPWADWVILRLCYKEMLNPAHSQPVKDGIWLNAPGRELVIGHMDTFLEKKIQYDQKRLSRRMHIHHEASRFAQELLNRQT